MMLFAINMIPKFCPNCGNPLGPVDAPENLQSKLKESEQEDFKNGHRFICKKCRGIEYQHVPSYALESVMGEHGV